MKLTVWGAARQVTGSMHLLELPGGKRILIDCGLDYEQQKFFGNIGEIEFPFHPTTIDTVILTHAHIDHSGNLPSLVKQGFRGKIVCTPPTADITGLLLADSLNIMASDNQKSGKGRGRKKGSTPYTYKHLRQTVDQMVAVEIGRNFKLTPDCEMQFVTSGHILGAASVLVRVNNNGKEIRIGFTGDLGNYDTPLVNNPEALPDLDYLITESTYGGRTHVAQRTPGEEMLHYINLACRLQPGRLIIPAFSVGRTHSIAYTLHKLYREGKLPHVKIFVDSPLAIKTAGYHHKYVHYLNPEAQEFYHQYRDLFEFDFLEFLENPKDSDSIQYHREPCVILSAAGMVEGGRIQQHIRNNISNPKAAVLIAGFCAEGTLGHRLLQGQPTIAIKKKEMPVHAAIYKTDAFSAHPDSGGLLKYVNETMNPRLKKIFLVHGEEASMVAFKMALSENGIDIAEIPNKGQTYEL